MALTPAEKLAAAIAGLAAVLAGASVVKPPVVTPPPPPSGAPAGWSHCQTVEQVFYAGDSLFYVRPLGTPSRDSLVKLDKTTNPLKPYGPQVLLCSDSIVGRSREVIASGFSKESLQ